ncbi:MAG: hypothetical protein R3221_02910 [Spongiibacter sp.]|nr:hypothetical protein [Spongiibacter sp.]
MRNIHSPLEVPRNKRIYKALASFGEHGATVHQLNKHMNGALTSTSIQSVVYLLVRLGYAKKIGVTADPARGYRNEAPPTVYAHTDKLSRERAA